MITSYEELLARLVQEKVEFALAGGLAVCLNGFVRTTDDVDILIDNSSDTSDACGNASLTLGRDTARSLPRKISATNQAQCASRSPSTSTSSSA
jgi:hypothetical protein